jgi:heme exporter protein A
MQAVPEASTNPSASTPETALRVEDLQYRIGLASILKKLRFDLYAGEVLSVLGPNGAGKSTLLKCLAGLLPCTGSLAVFGNANRRDPAVRRSLGYLGHETFLYSKLSAEENLRFFANLYGVNADTTAILAEYHLAFAGDQLVETYSRGMKQRLALARALLNSPRLLLMDEPFTGLDQQAGELLEARIRRLRGSTTVIMVTHELDRAEEFSDCFLILKNGKQVFFGHKDEVQGSLAEFYRTKTA